jgi:CRISPR-associated endonuclease/helicase Cas3
MGTKKSQVSKQNDYYAHSKENYPRSEWQKLKDHLLSTSRLAAELGRDAGVSDLAGVAGLLHDIGKYSLAFQKRLQGAKHRVDHATAGAKLITSLFPTGVQKILAEILSYCIAGHHSGLPDYGSVIDMETNGTLYARINKKHVEEFNAYENEIDLSALELKSLTINPIQGHTGFSVSFLIRMLYSTLVDADYQETETYMGGGSKQRGSYANIETLTAKFNQFLQKFQNPSTAIDIKRTQTLHACLDKARNKPGFFSLTVPTGGGKTFSSMAFALNHAVAHGMKRIIYVIPFTSIIEQNAAEFKKCLGSENILEHHSNFDWDHNRSLHIDGQTNQASEKLKLAAENWDIPIVMTTNVQFFESLFANRSSRSRKLHNIARSVIIFDEVQMLPRGYLKPSMLAVQELVQNYNTSVVFCTATQPSLDRFLPDVEFTELAPNPQVLFDCFQRVRITNRGTLSDETLISELNTSKQALCIVNTRKHALGIFNCLPEKTSNFHLSTLMCPAHRQETMASIRTNLKNELLCLVISTQVMEAGIDVDFPVGYRSIAGLDSIIQAAGRVNREGKQPHLADVFVFVPQSSFIKSIPRYIQQGAAVAKSILKNFPGDPVSIKAINTYFSQLYRLQDEGAFDIKNIIACFDKTPKGLNFDFKTAAHKFKLIENNTVSLIIPFNHHACDLIEDLRVCEFPAAFLRQLQPYSVNIYKQEFEALESKGVVELCAEKYPVLQKESKEEYYHPKTGIIIPEVGGDALFF